MVNSLNISISIYSLKKYNLSSGQCKFADKFAKLWDTIPECIQNARSVEIFKTHILTVSHERCIHMQAFHDIYA